MTLQLKRRGYSDCLQRPKYMLYAKKKSFKYKDGKKQMNRTINM